MTATPPVPIRRVLVVEDHPDERDALTILLQTAGYSVRAEPDRDAALQALRDGHRPNLIVLDLMMTGMDAEEFVRSLRDDPSCSRIPVVVYAATSDVRAAARQLGIPAFARKGDVQHLLSLVALLA